MVSKILGWFCIFILVPVFAFASPTLHWNPCDNCVAYRVVIDGQVFVEKTTETKVDLAALNMVEGREYDCRVYGINTANQIDIIGAPVILKYTHHNAVIMPPQNIPPPQDSHIVIDVNININQ